MTLLRPDPTFYPSPQMACKAPVERHGYVAVLNYGGNNRPDALAVVDLDPASSKIRAGHQPSRVGMRVSMRDLFFWSFLMATAHGAGVMVAPDVHETKPVKERL